MARRFRPLLLGRDVANGEPLRLNPEWFETHLHLLGPPGKGKTRLLLWIFQYLARIPRATIVLVNPKGALARMARDWALGHGQSERLVWFDPGDPQFVMGYNPLRSNRLSVARHAKGVREAIRSAWGQASFDQTPQLARLLYFSIAVSLALDRTLLDALRLLRSGRVGSEVRRAFLSRLERGNARGEPELISFLGDALAWFDSLAERRQEELAASALARLESFACDPFISRILTQPQCLDFGELIAHHKILLVNLEIGRPLLIDDLKLLGRFVVNDVVNHVFSRPESKDEPVYLILDEVQNFATRDLCSILDMGRELGLHCIFAHQNLGQLKGEDETGCLYASVKGCALTKFYFGGLDVEDLQILVKDACIEEFDPYKVKDELRTLVLDPIESRRTIFTAGLQFGGSIGNARGKSRARSNAQSVGISSSEGESSSDSEGSAIGSSMGHVIGRSSGQSGGETILPGSEIIQTVHEMEGTSEADIASDSELLTTSHSQGTHSSRGIHASQTEGKVEGTQEVENSSLSGGMNIGISRVPFYEYKKEWRVSSRTFESQEEFLVKKLQKMKGLPRAHAFVKVSGKPGRFVALPDVRTQLVSSNTREAALKRVFSQPFYFRSDEARSDKHIDEDSAPLKTLGTGETIPKTRNLLPEPKPNQIAGNKDEQIITRTPAESLDQWDNDEQFAGPEIILKPRETKRKK